MRSFSSSRRSTEGFVHWKQGQVVHERGGSADGTTCESESSRQERRMGNRGSSGRGLPASALFSGRGVLMKQGICREDNLQIVRRESLTSTTKNLEHHAKTSNKRNREVVGKKEGVISKGGLDMGFSSPAQVRERLPTARDSPVHVFSSHRVPTSSTASTIQRKKASTSDSKILPSKVASRTGGPSRASNFSVREQGSLSFPSGWENQNICEQVRKGSKAAFMEEEDQNKDSEEEDFAEDDYNATSEAHVEGFENEDPNDDNVPSISEGRLGRPVVHHNDVEDIHHRRDIVEWAPQDESAKRRERRHVQAAQEREGDRRKKTGLRRNYLMVDEYMKKPFGPGVGEWRKELLLLSRNLDPATGNINRQLDGAMAEIAEWIQHTWEYSGLVKFEFVKDVVARGVTLRRAELWKKIQNEEPKPENVSDQSWWSLARQLETDAACIPLLKTVMDFLSETGRVPSDLSNFVRNAR